MHNPTLFKTLTLGQKAAVAAHGAFRLSPVLSMAIFSILACLRAYIRPMAALGWAGSSPSDPLSDFFPCALLYGSLFGIPSLMASATPTLSRRLARKGMDSSAEALSRERDALRERTPACSQSSPPNRL